MLLNAFLIGFKQFKPSKKSNNSIDLNDAFNIMKTRFLN